MMWLKYLRLAWVFVSAFQQVWFRFPQLSPQHKLQHIQQWAQKALKILNVQLHATRGPNPPSASAILLVSNHVSWLDILVIQALQPCVFVAKLEVKKWPVIGTLAQACGAIFVDRSSAHATRAMVQEVASALERGYCVAGFPEGTSSDGLAVQLFHANLFEAALLVDIQVQPMALRYVDPQTETLCKAAAFVGDVGFLASLHQVVQTSAIVAKAKLDKRLAPKGHSRRTLAHLSHRHVSHSLACL